ncbi:hypothetical protein, partial [Vibrio cidicii]|uniref:hypothetical protein n=1 Tax=Vibrio cidicii TaxID=1763883 RepID=UPI0037048A90
FSGPWASEFADAYRSTTSEIVHRILEKESITDQDYAEVSSAYVKCMANKGFKAEVTGPFGESVVDAGPGDDAAQVECDKDMSVIAALRRSVDRNPDHRDEEEIVAAVSSTRKWPRPDTRSAITKPTSRPRSSRTASKIRASLRASTTRSVWRPGSEAFTAAPVAARCT